MRVQYKMCSQCSQSACEMIKLTYSPTFRFPSILSPTTATVLPTHNHSTGAAAGGGGGACVGQINLRGWASSKQSAVPEKAQVHSCIIRLLNGVLGQRGQLINEVASEAVAVRLTGFVLDFSMWMPKVGTLTDDAIAWGSAVQWSVHVDASRRA